MRQQIPTGEGLPLRQYQPVWVAFIKLEEGLKDTPGCVCEEAGGQIEVGANQVIYQQKKCTICVLDRLSCNLV